MDKADVKVKSQPKDWHALSTRQSKFIGLITVVVLITFWLEGIGWAVGAGVFLLFALAITYAGLKITWRLITWTIGLGLLVALMLPNFVHFR